MALKVITINASGMQNTVKRRAIFDFARNRADIICIQETHSSTNCENRWRLEWGSDIFFSHGETNARGTAILISKKLKSDTQLLEKDTKGRRVSIKVKFQETEILICNIYAPNPDTPEFFEEMINVTYEQCENVIYIGDYNVVMDTNIDRRGSKYNNDKSSNFLRSACETYLLSDPWRDRNQGVKRYSYMRKKQAIASRIDYALVAQGLQSKIASSFYVPCPITDHSAFFLSINFQEEERGKGYWKMNNSLLEDDQYIEMIQQTLANAVLKYKEHSAIDRWELIKFEAANRSQKWSRDKAVEKRLVTNQLYDKLTELEEKVSDTGLERDYDLLERTKEDLKTLEMEKSKGILFRSKARWQCEAERNTSYFYALEKAKYNTKTCASLMRDDGTIERNPKKILHLQRKYYKDLYSKDRQVKFKAPDMVSPKLTKEERDMMEEPINIQELEIAVKQMANGKVPGSDGLSADFYKKFFNDLKEPLHQCIQEGLKNKKMHNSARRGIISLIPKPKVDARKLKNQRPITLLNVDLKIMEKAISNRFLTVMNKLIHPQQKGFMRGRRIAANIRKVLEIIKHANDTEEAGLVISVDFQKCFDKISFDIIYGSLKHFGFGPIMIETIKTMYSNFTVCIQNNGNFSEPFEVK